MAAGRRPARSLARRLHRHLISECAECRAAWEALGDGRRALLALLDRELAAGRRSPSAARPRPSSARRPSRGTAGPAADAAGDADDGSRYGSAFESTKRRLDDEMARLSARRRRAERDLRTLLAVPPANRARKVVDARTRYRSRAFAERLLEEARRRVRTDPRESAALAELVPLVVLWTPGALPSAWGHELVVRARAWQANALRVAGDLLRADHELATLRRELAGRAPGDELAGELDSLEASLRLDQGRLAEAGACLDRAVRHLARVGAPDILAGAMIKRAELYRQLGRPDDAFAESGRALAQLGDSPPAVLYLCAVGTQALALCNLDRCREARSVMTEAAREWDRHEEPWWALRRAMIEGRIHFGLDEMAAAERKFRAVLDRCGELGLAYEAAVTALDLAMVYLADGRTAEVRRLAAEAAPILYKEQHRETLAALTLFRRAALAETLTLASARRLRDHLERAHRRAHPAADA